MSRRRSEVLIRITAPTFVAGAVLRGDAVERCAPLLRWHLRRRGLSGVEGLRTLVRATGWRVEVVEVVED